MTKMRLATLPAPAGSLSHEAAVEVRALRAFMERREAALDHLFGRKIRRSPLRDELVRLVVLAFADGQRLTISECQRRMAARRLGSAPAVRDAIDFLAEAGLIVVEESLEDRRSRRVIASARLTRYYSREMPKLLTEILRILPDLEAAIRQGNKTISL